LREDLAFQRAGEASEWDSSEPLADAGMPTSVAASLAAETKGLNLLGQLSYWCSQGTAFVPSADADCYQNYDAETPRSAALAMCRSATGLVKPA